MNYLNNEIDEEWKNIFAQDFHSFFTQKREENADYFAGVPATFISNFFNCLCRKWNFHFLHQQ